MTPLMRRVLVSFCISLVPVLRANDFTRVDSERSAESHTSVIGDQEIELDFEEYVGRKPSRRELSYYHDQAAQQRWDRERFRAELQRSDACRDLTPDRAIDDAFRDVFKREPTRREVEAYRDRFADEHWTPGELRRQLRDSREYKEVYIDRAIERAYRELLDRRPDVAGRNHYRDLMLRHGLTEDELVRRIRQSDEYRVDMPRGRVTRAYREVFHRDPDPRGLETYRKRVLDDGWTEDDIIHDLHRSAEYAAVVDGIIRSAYREILHRDPDARGLESYRRVMLERGWTEERLREDLKNSEEYRAQNPGKKDKHRKH